jgi:hypothetical protein
MSVSALVARDAKSYQILGRVIAEAAPRLNVMDLKILRSPADLATLAFSLQNFMANVAISIGLEFQTWLF